MNINAPFPRIQARISAAALAHNLRVLHRLAGGKPLIPMIKANAYGHGAVWAAKTLSQNSDLAEKIDSWGVATLEEGRELRRALGRRHEIIVFSGASPWSGHWTEHLGQWCEAYRLTPVISSAADWKSFSRSRYVRTLSYELKFNTGMNRLGLPPSMALEIVQDLKKRRLPLPRGVCSHLAMAETPKHPLTQHQVEAFGHLVSQFAGLPGPRFHLANSSGIWNLKALGLDEMTDWVRPGIALYGIPPSPQAPRRGLKAVMEIQAKVLQTRKLERGDPVGYGARFIADAPCRIAILGAGYADGFHRAASSRGTVILGGKRESILGIISMDLSAVSTSARVQPGDWATLWGQKLDPWKTAKEAGTIPYEILTSVGARVQRIYSEPE